MNKQIKIGSIEDFNETLGRYPGIPVEALTDITSRIGDWMTSGGSLDDPYIK